MDLHYTNERNVQIVIALLKSHNIKKVVASPGTTNITFIGSIMHDSFFEIYSSVDERSAAYIACGLAEESGEAVVISCTGATASRNYFSGLTEAYYRKLPIVVITSTQDVSNIGHLKAQVIDRSVQPNDIVKCSVHLQTIKDKTDEWDCVIKTNKALLELFHHGAGPVHINLTTTYSKNYSVLTIPEVRKIERIYYNSSLPLIPKGKIAIYVGSHLPFTSELNKAIDDFCLCNNAVVFCEPTSNYHGKYRVMYGLVAIQNIHDDLLEPDLLIHIGEVSDFTKYYSKAKQVWRVSEDGRIVDHFKKLSYVFEMSEKEFFIKYTSEYKDDDSYLYACKDKCDKLMREIPDLPFSNIWIASTIHNGIPTNSELHLGILNSLRAWNFFDNNVERVFSNQGGFGIDGNMSAMIGASLVYPDKLYYLILGDLSFFYDMNVLGNRHVGSNIRILLINNGKGSEFHLRGNPGSMFFPETGKYISADGHFTNKSPEIVKKIAEVWGFDYLSAYNKDDFKTALPTFLSTEKTYNKPIIFEVFTHVEDEDEALFMIKNIEHNPKTGVGILKDGIKSVIGEKASDIIRRIVK